MPSRRSFFQAGLPDPKRPVANSGRAQTGGYTAQVACFARCRADIPQYIGWDRSPLRRRHFRRRKAKPPQKTQLGQSLTLLGIGILTCLYYTSPNRSSMLIIGMDALICTHCLATLLQAGLHIAAASAKRAGGGFQIWTTPPVDRNIGASYRYLEIVQNSLNQLMHALNGNVVTICLESLIGHQHPEITAADLPETEADFLSHKLSLSRNFLLSCRVPPKPGVPLIHPIPVLPQLAPRPRLHRSGRRRVFRTSQGSKIFFSTHKTRIRNLPHTASKPTPPQRGLPGTTTVVNEECQPHDPPLHSLLGWGTQCRRLRRRLFRRWRGTVRESIPSVSLGNLPVKESQPLKAEARCRRTKNVARLFRQLVLKAENSCSRERKILKPQTTPPLGYGQVLRVVALNVQCMTELLKHQEVLNLRSELSLDILFLTETHSTSYYSFRSSSHLFIVNGTHKDKWSGVTAVIAPKLIPYVKNVTQHSSRILQVTIASSSGDIHFIGVYAPHDKSDITTKKEPFWSKLHDITSAIPLPEPYYIIGDWNVRLQGRSEEEKDILGPHIYGRGKQFANTRDNSNRTEYTAFLSSQAAVDALSYKQPNLLKQITYRDKQAPPRSWDQFISDDLGWLQLWDKVQALPAQEDDLLAVVGTIRNYLGVDTLPFLGSYAPVVDPLRFQSLDRLVVARKWLPTVLQLRALHHTGFPSDHFPLFAKIRVKLGALPKPPPAKPRYAYKSDEYTAKTFNRAVRAHYGATTVLTTNQHGAPKLQVYTDGSGSRGKCSATTPAGWGYVVLQEQKVVHDASGPVCTNQNAAHYLGATVGSNNTGELTAWLEAALYLLGTPEYVPKAVEFCYDSKWMHSMVTGTARPKRHKALVYLSKRVHRLLSKRTTITWQWIKGHTGNQYNEKADELAETGKTTAQFQGGRSEAHTFLSPANLPNSEEALPPLEGTLDESNKQLVSALLQAEEITFQRQEFAPRANWMPPELATRLEQIKTRRRAHDYTAHQDYKKAKAEARKIKREWLRSQLYMDSQSGSTKLWQATRKLKTGFRARRTRLKQNGRPVPWSKTHHVFADHLSNKQWAPSTVTEEELQLLRESPPLHSPPSTPPSKFTLEELEDILFQLKKGKAPGPDNVRTELVMLLDHFGKLRLLQILNESFERRSVPSSWKEAMIVSIYKGKGADSDPANYRPISLLNVFYKVYAALLQRRLARAHDHHLRTTQYGFRRDRSTRDPLFILRRAQDLATPCNYCF